MNGQSTNYTLDLNPSTSLRAGSGLTQVLDDGTNTYLYGLGRVAQTNTQTEYFFGDALGSVRQMVNDNGTVVLAKSYNSYGEVTSSAGTSSSPFAFTGEATDATGLTYLRARYYNPADGRFTSRDTWGGDVMRPLSLNRWMYVEGNPVNRVDPTGHKPLRIGYVEGRSISYGLIIGDIIEGAEIVYDYATMTRARFAYTGTVKGLVASIGGTAYVGEIGGFRYGLPLDTQDKNNLFIDDYSKDFYGVYFGAGVKPVEGVTVGAGIFHSPDWSVRGLFQYASGGFGIPVEGVFFHTFYTVDSEVEHYADEKGHVDRTKLISDILIRLYPK